MAKTARRRRKRPAAIAAPRRRGAMRSAARIEAVIDPGHGGIERVGGSTPNDAVGPAGLLEKSIALDIARRAVRRLSNRGRRAALTRDADANLSLEDRAAVARGAGAPVFVSVHFHA